MMAKFICIAQANGCCLLIVYDNTPLQGRIMFNSEGIRQGIDLEVWRYKYETTGEPKQTESN